MSKSLEPNPLVLPPRLSRFLGRSAATLLQQIHYWLQKSRHVIDGLRWIYNSYSAWAEQIFLSISTVKRAVALLKSLKLIRIERHSKSELHHVNWYTIDYEQLERLEALISSIGSKWPSRSVQNELIDRFKLNPSSICISETSSETSSHRDPPNLEREKTTPTDPTEPAPSIPSAADVSPGLVQHQEPQAIGADQNSAAPLLANFEVAIDAPNWNVQQAPWKASLGRYHDAMLEAVFVSYPNGQAFKLDSNKRNTVTIARYLNKLSSQAEKLSQPNAIDARSELLLLWRLAQEIEAKQRESEQLRSSSCPDAVFSAPESDEQRRVEVLNGLLKAGRQPQVLKMLTDHPEWRLEFNGAAVVEVIR